MGNGASYPLKSCPQSTSPIDVSVTLDMDQCNSFCNYSIDYAKTPLKVKNTGISLDISEVAPTAPNGSASFNGVKYKIYQARIFSPSVHTFNGNHADAELIIIHAPLIGSYNSPNDPMPLCVCIPIKGDDTTTGATAGAALLQELISQINDNANTFMDPKDSIQCYQSNNICPEGYSLRAPPEAAGTPAEQIARAKAGEKVIAYDGTGVCPTCPGVTPTPSGGTKGPALLGSDGSLDCDQCACISIDQCKKSSDSGDTFTIKTSPSFDFSFKDIIPMSPYIYYTGIFVNLLLTLGMSDGVLSALNMDSKNPEPEIAEFELIFKDIGSSMPDYLSSLDFCKDAYKYVPQSAKPAIFIVFTEPGAISIPTASIAILQKLITPTYFTIYTPPTDTSQPSTDASFNGPYYNSVGPSITDAPSDQVYISCRPTDASGEILVDAPSTPTTIWGKDLLDTILQSGAITAFIGLIIMFVIYKMAMKLFQGLGVTPSGGASDERNAKKVSKYKKIRQGHTRKKWAGKKIDNAKKFLHLQ